MHCVEMWVNVIPDCSEATGSKAFLKETCLKWCCDNSYISFLVMESAEEENSTHDCVPGAGIQ